MKQTSDYFVHESSYIDEACSIAKGTKIWHFCHIMKESVIGENCNLGQNVVIYKNPVTAAGWPLATDLFPFDLISTRRLQ
jgi:UDP-3-O-[3-hydroxymyristoyl] glucosamine N-acyltransferase